MKRDAAGVWQNMQLETQDLRCAGAEWPAASRTNIEVVRKAIDAFNECDLDAALALVDSQAELDWSRSLGVEAGVYRGYDACRRFWTNLIDTFERVTVDVAELIDAGDHVVAPNRARMWGRDGIEVAARSVLVVTFRDGRIVRWTLYQEKPDALEAPGLGEKTGV
jgi:ketosteroid isomerase-like protein